MNQRPMDVAVVIPANTFIENVLEGRLYQQMPFQYQIVSLLATGSAAGLEHQLIIAGTTVIPSGALNANNRQPIEPEDTILSSADALYGQGLFLGVRNTTGGPLTYRARVVITEAQYG